MSSRFRHALLFLPALLLALAAGPGPAAAQQMTMMPPSQAALIHTLLPTVVNIHSVVGTLVPPLSDAQVAMSSSEPAKPSTLDGSGFIVDPSGMIVTNYHVVAGAYEITVMFDDGTRVPAKLVGAATGVDIAIIKVDVGHPLPTVAWANSDQVQIGDAVFAIGNPLGIGLSVSGGLVSALNRNIMDTPDDNYIQTDAAINHGNSGGPLFTRDGKVIGMDTAIISPTHGSVGLGFAIPANEVRFCADQLIRFGHVQPGFLGIKVEEVTPDMAEALGMTRPRGAIVALVHPGSPAELAGIRVGDIVVGYDKATPVDDRALLREIAMTPVGTVAPVELLRGGTTVTVQATITKWPEQLWAKLNPVQQTVPIKLDIPPNLGLNLEALSSDARERYGLTMHQPGVVIVGVAAGTDAANRGLKAGDVLLEVQSTEVHTPAEVQAALDAARAEKRSFVVALVLSKTPEVPGPTWTALRVSSP